MSEVTEIISGISGWIAAGAAVGAAALSLRKRLSRDATELQSDKSERDQLARLESENERLLQQLEVARSAQAQRAHDAITIASLETEQKLLVRDIKRLLKRMPPDMRQQLRDAGALESSFAALGDVEERIEPKS